MFYFSSILGKSVRNEEGRRTGRVFDMMVRADEAFPRIYSVVLQRGIKKMIIPWEKIKHVDHEGVIFRGNSEDFTEFVPNGELLLRRDILDKQIVDVDGHRVVRVNDIQLNMLEDSMRLAGVDVGTPGLLRRMGLLEISQNFSKILKLKTPTNIIPWQTVQFLGPAGSSLRLTTTYKKLTRLHPADLADILEDLSGAQRIDLFRSLDTETAAETLEHMEEDAQIALFNNLSDEKASDILEEMSPDDAADLLQDLPQERAQALLGLMEEEDAEDMRELLTYPQNTAGGLMSTEFIYGSPSMTCQEAIELIRRLSYKAELVYYIYVVDENMHLRGVLSLRDIIVNEPDTPLSKIMSEEPLSIPDNGEVKEVVDLIAKYDLLAVPVVDKNGEIKGIITFDDVMDQLIPGESRSS